MDGTARPKDGNAEDFRSWMRLWRDWLHVHRWLLGLSIALTMVVAVTAGAYAKIIQLVMAALEARDPAVIWWGPLTVIVVTAISAVAQYYKETVSNGVITRMETELRKTMFARLVGTDLAQLQTEVPAGLAARFSSDISLVGGAVRAFISGLTGILTIVTTVAIMLSIDWVLTIGMVLIFSLALVPVNIIGRHLRRISTKTQTEISRMTSEVTEGLSGIRMARTYRLEEPLSASADSVFERLFGLKIQQYAWRSRMAPLMEVLIGVAVAILLFVVARRINAGTTSVADFTGLLTGLGVLSGPARRMGGTYATMMQGRAALDRVFMLFDVENAITDGDRTLERATGSDPVRRRLLRLSRRTCGAPECLARNSAGHPHRLRRSIGSGQVDDLQSASAAL